MSQEVAPILMQVATPFCASVRVPVVELLTSVNVSDVIAIDKALALRLITINTVPVEKGTVALAGMVNVTLLPFIARVLPASEAMSV